MVSMWLLILFIACVGFAGIMVVIMAVHAFGNRIIAEEIVLDSLPPAFDGFRILFITDIHRRSLPAALLEPLRGKVDAVFLGGDLTEKGGSIERLHQNMVLTASLGPVYAVHGNHDYRANTPLVDNIIRGSGVKLMMDENLSIWRDGARIILTGVDFPRTGGKRAYSPLPSVAAEDAKIFRIILVHDPLWLTQQNEVPAGLILAGHTHGGQVILPILGRRHVEAFYHEYSAGMYELPAPWNAAAPVKLLISRGFGTAHLPLRWGSPAEMHVLTLRCGQN